MRNDKKITVVATTDERTAAQQRQVTDGEEYRRGDWAKGALGDPGKGDRDDETSEPSRRTRPSLLDPFGAAACHFLNGAIRILPPPPRTGAI